MSDFCTELQRSSTDITDSLLFHKRYQWIHLTFCLISEGVCEGDTFLEMPHELTVTSAVLADGCSSHLLYLRLHLDRVAKKKEAKMTERVETNTYVSLRSKQHPILEFHHKSEDLVKTTCSHRVVMLKLLFHQILLMISVNNSNVFTPLKQLHWMVSTCDIILLSDVRETFFKVLLADISKTHIWGNSFLLYLLYLFSGLSCRKKTKATFINLLTWYSVKTGPELTVFLFIWRT